MPPTDHFLRTGVALPGKNEILCPAAMIQSRGAQSLAQHTTVRFLPKNTAVAFWWRLDMGFFLLLFWWILFWEREGWHCCGFVFFLYSLSESGSQFPQNHLKPANHSGQTRDWSLPTFSSLANASGRVWEESKHTPTFPLLASRNLWPRYLLRQGWSGMGFKLQCQMCVFKGVAGRYSVTSQNVKTAADVLVL